MPNAQTHIASVCNLLVQENMITQFPWLNNDEVKSALLLGAISPDVRIISDQHREETHFFAIEADGLMMLDDAAPERAFLQKWSELSNPASLTKAHAAFVAGYMAHLIMDFVWVDQVVMNGIFIKGQKWQTGHPNWRIYSLLMTYLEYQAAGKIDNNTAPLLDSVQPQNWLPFVRDEHLSTWRDHVVHMIRGGTKRLSKAFAASNNMTADELESIVLSEERMTSEAFHLVSRDKIAAFRAITETRSQQAITAYLAGEMANADTTQEAS